MFRRSGDCINSLFCCGAECSCRFQEYKGACALYAKLLEFHYDRFFITTSVMLMEHKQDRVRRFAAHIEPQ